jgi:hypothetical protein
VENEARLEAHRAKSGNASTAICAIFFFLQKAQAEHQARIWSRDDVEV